MLQSGLETAWRTATGPGYISTKFQSEAFGSPCSSRPLTSPIATHSRSIALPPARYIQILLYLFRRENSLLFSLPAASPPLFYYGSDSTDCRPVLSSSLQ